MKIPTELRREIRRWWRASALAPDEAIHELAKVIDPGAAVSTAPAGFRVVRMSDRGQDPASRARGPLSREEVAEKDRLTGLALSARLDPPGQHRLMTLLDRALAARGAKQ